MGPYPGDGERKGLLGLRRTGPIGQEVMHRAAQASALLASGFPRGEAFGHV